MSGLGGASSSLRGCDLGWKGVEIDEQEFAELMHLVGDFLGRLILAMNSFISIKAKFVRPGLQLRSDSMLRSHFVDAFLDLPSFYIGGKRLESQLHSFPVHAGSGIEVAACATSGCLPERLRHAVGNAARCLVNVSWRIHRRQGEEGRSKDVPLNLREVKPMPTAIGGLINYEANRLKTGIARRGDGDFARASLNIEKRPNFKCDPCAFAVGAIMHQRCHGDLFSCKSGIVA